MDTNELINHLIELATKKGADPELTRSIRANQVVVPNQWVRWKCKFSCGLYGKRLCCPPYAPNPSETRELLRDYGIGILVGFRGDLSKEGYHDLQKRNHKVMLRLEKEAFMANRVKAMAFSTGACVLCEECILKELSDDLPIEIARTKCKHKEKMRPSMEAVGIDVFGTVKNVGLKLEVLTDDSNEVKNFGLLLID
ncbi:MAG: DUF2284 domain-containing protein [Candidatus Helarchaeales archaeon]